MSSRVTTELVTKALADEATPPCWESEPAATALLARAIGRVGSSDLLCQLSLRQPVVAVGAPVTAYLPRTAEQLGTELVIPPHAEVANAVGAVAGSVVQRLRALIRPVGPEPTYRLHLPDSVHDFRRLEEAVRYAQETLPEEVAAIARAAGAEQLEVKVERLDHTTPLETEWGQELYIETELVFSAIGRPGLVQR